MFWCLFLRSWRRQVQMLRSHESVHRARRAWGLAATQDLLAFESENIRKDLISEYLGDESDQRTRFEKPTTVNEIEQRERERIPLKTWQSTSLSVNVYQPWAEHRNSQIESLQDEYSSVPFNFQSTTVAEINYWLTRFIYLFKII